MQRPRLRRHTTGVSRERIPPPAFASLALGHAAYYALTGVWPLVHIESFEAITGPKADRWLVKTVGGLVAAVGASVGVAGWRRRLTSETATLAIGAAAALATVDVVYVAQRRIRPVYLGDATAEAALIAAWTWLWQASRRGN